MTKIDDIEFYHEDEILIYEFQISEDDVVVDEWITEWSNEVFFEEEMKFRRFFNEDPRQPKLISKELDALDQIASSCWKN